MSLNARNVSVTVALAATLCAVPSIAVADTAPEGEPLTLAEGQVAPGEQPGATEAPATGQAAGGTDARVTAAAATAGSETTPTEKDVEPVAVTDDAGRSGTPGDTEVIEAPEGPAGASLPREVSAQAPAASAPTAEVSAPTEGSGAIEVTSTEATGVPTSAPAASIVDPAPAKPDEERVLIPDDNLRAVIEKSLGKRAGEKITAAELETLREVNAYHTGLMGSKVRSISGLELARNLEVLNLNENSVSDLAPLAQLTSLRELRLVRNEVSDLTPIAGLTDLRVLDIYYNHVTDISVLSNLRELEYLDMHACNRTEAIGSIEPLAHLTKLRYLSIESNHIRDIGCLGDVAQHMADAVTGEPSDNPPTFLVRVNHITDLSVLKPLLNKKYVELGGIYEGNDIEEKVVVGTINQSTDPIDVTVTSDGGEVLVRLPEIRGFEDVDAAISGMFDVDTVRFAALENAPDGYELEPTEDGNAMLRVPANVVGAVRDEVVNVYLTYEGTDFLFVQPVHVRQQPRYLFTLDVAGEGELISFTQESGETNASRTVRATVSDAKGDPADLEDVTVTFGGRAYLGSSQDAFLAKDLRVERGGFSFELAKRPGEGALGSFELRPRISFRVRGDATTYIVPADGFTIRNVVIRQAQAGERPTDELVARVVFDLAKKNDDASYTSEQIDLTLPFDDVIETHYLTALDESGTRIAGARVTDGKATLTLTREQIRQLAGLQLMVAKPKGGTGGVGTGDATRGAVDANAATAGSAATPLRATSSVPSTSYLYPRLELIVRKLRNAWTSGPAMSGWTEGDRETDPTATAKAGAVSFRYFDADGNELPAKPHAAGRYFVRAFAAGDEDHDALESELLPFEIDPHAEGPGAAAKADAPGTGAEAVWTVGEKDGAGGDAVADTGLRTVRTGHRRRPEHLAAQASVPATGDRTDQAATGTALAGGVLALLAGLLGRRRGAHEER
ncbi:MAG: leucine-rich repeat domain-containing protein [Atopobiaceae bacterium]|nr:leucine-rich repeat domain-containing protein [Atopobiaceae bacterium]